MLQLLNNRKFLIIFGVLVLITLIISLIIKPTTILPEIIKTSPVERSTKVNYFDNISFTFNVDIDPTLVSLTSIPEENWQKSPKSTREIIFNSAQYLQVNTQYILTLSYQNKPIHTLTFTTIPQQSDPRYVQEVNNEIERDYPLAVKTPYDAPGFTVVYSKPLALEITLKEGVEERSEIINAVRDWVKESGLDPDSHTYSFSN